MCILFKIRFCEGKDTFNITETVICEVAKNGFFGFAKGRLCVSGKTKCAICGLAKIVFKKVRWEKNKKHWVGNECRLTHCPVCCIVSMSLVTCQNGLFFLFMSFVYLLLCILLCLLVMAVLCDVPPR